MPKARVLLALAGVALAACEGTDLERSLETVGPRGAQITSLLAQADEPFLRGRPALAAGKYVRMAASPYDYFRGSVPVYRADARTGTQPVSVSRFGLTLPLVPSHGDPHPENFGMLRAADGTLALEPNDFDTADHAPYLWDVRRLTTGMALAAILANDDDATARARTSAERRAIARAAAEAYRDAVERAATGTPPSLVGMADGAIVAELRRRSVRDHASREELAVLTRLEGSARTFLRGVPDPEDPQHVLAELPAFAREAIPTALAGYRSSLVVPVPAEELVVLDAVRELGSGVASWPRVRALVLVRGPSDAPDDDVILELKELTDSAISVSVPPFVHADDVQRRVLGAARDAWARVDAEPRWGTTRWLGLPCQVRVESEGQKGVRIARMREELGTPEALSELARTLGVVVARIHVGDRRDPARGLARARAIATRIAADREGFADEQADAGVAYAETTLGDHAAFVRALRVLGLRLGLPPSPEDAPRPDLALLYGTPPAPPPLPEGP